MKTTMAIAALFVALWSCCARTAAAVDVVSYDQTESNVGGLSGYTIEWATWETTDGGAGKEIQLRISAPTNGWVGFGLSKGSGMKGADIFWGYVDDDSGKVFGTDRFAVKEGQPQLDECESDWNVVSGSQESGRTTIEISRKINTGDPEDWPFVSVDSVGHDSVIVAYGDSDALDYHGTNQRTSAQINFGNGSMSLNDRLAELEADPNVVGEFLGYVSPYNVPSQQTTYHDECVTAEGPMDLSVVRSMVGFKFNDTSLDVDGYEVHHVVLYGYYLPSSSANLTYNFGCDGDEYESKLIWVGVPGVDADVFLNDMRLKYGGDGGIAAFKLQFHYENYAGRSDFHDDSGLTVYFNDDTSRDWTDVGVAILGDSNLQTMDTAIPAGITQYDFTCPAGCFQDTSERRTIIKILHHMHGEGVAQQTRLTENGVTTGLANSEYYDFNFQDEVTDFGLGLDETLQFGSDTKFETRCVFNSESGSKFGLASADEMCQSIVYYYPAGNNDAGFCGYSADITNEGNPSCWTDAYDTNSLNDLTDIEWRTFGFEVGACTEDDFWSSDEAIAIFASVVFVAVLLIVIGIVCYVRTTRDPSVASGDSKGDLEMSTS